MCKSISDRNSITLRVIEPLFMIYTKIFTLPNLSRMIELNNPNIYNPFVDGDYIIAKHTYTIPQKDEGPPQAYEPITQ